MWFYEEGQPIGGRRRKELMARLVEEIRSRTGKPLGRVLLVPPDRTRYDSGCGELANTLYHLLEPSCQTDIMPALGQHLPHSAQENRWMFGDIPQERFLDHDWDSNCVHAGEVSGEFVRRATGGGADWPIPIEIDRAVMEGGYDAIVSLGQVVPHEVLGFASHNKNLIIGVGGKSTICASHLLSGCCDIEDILGQIVTPLRACFNAAERDFLGHIPVVHLLVVKTRSETNEYKLSGLYVGGDIDTYIHAARYARAHTINVFEKPIRKIVCFMNGDEYKSTWVANKAVYRTRKVLSDGGELIVIAPGVRCFGEHDDEERLIRQYGYTGQERILKACETDSEFKRLGHAPAHLIHGSSEGRFTITYAPGHLTREYIESVGYQYMDIQQALERYKPESLQEGFNTVNGEEIFFIGSPGQALWTSRERFVKSLENNRVFAQRMAAWEPAGKLWGQLLSWDDEDIAKYANGAWRSQE